MKTLFILSLVCFAILVLSQKTASKSEPTATKKREYTISEQEFFGGIDDIKLNQLKKEKPPVVKQKTPKPKTPASTKQKSPAFELSEDEILRRINIKIQQEKQRKSPSKASSNIKSDQSKSSSKVEQNVVPKKDKDVTSKSTQTGVNTKPTENSDSKAKASNEENQETDSENLLHQINFEHVEHTQKPILPDSIHHFTDDSSEEELSHQDDEFMEREEKMDFMHEHHDQHVHDEL